ncbi:MAG: heme ABC exporter ATP-binding protein CcmA [Rhizobiaceae bacterium]
MQLIAESLAAERSGELVFSDISFSLDKGDGLIITGPNGAGKSTLLRVIAGLLPSLGGSLEFESGDSWTGLADACHYLGHKNAMKDALSVRENLTFWQAFYGPPHMTIDDALNYVGLQSTADLPFGYLSTGQRRRISIAKLLINYRPVWLLDEPTAGLDADSEQVVSHLLREHLDDGDIAIVATHLPLGLEGLKELKLELHP